MPIWINDRLGGFRKWSEAQELKHGAEAQDSDGPTQDSDEELIAPDQTPHRPWLVPGAGRL